MKGCALALLAALAAAPVQAQAVADARAAEMRVLDRMTGDTQDITVPMGGRVRIGALTVRVDECRYPVDNPSGDAYAFLRIADDGSSEPLFQGWMIASSPALNAFDHRRYDIWVLRCSTS